MAHLFTNTLAGNMLSGRELNVCACVVQVVRLADYVSESLGRMQGKRQHQHQHQHPLQQVLVVI